MLRTIATLLFVDFGQFQTIKVAHIEYTTAQLKNGQMEALAAFRLAEKRLHDEKISPKSINFSFAWEPVDAPENSPGVAAHLYYVKNHSDWIIGPSNSNGKNFCSFKKKFEISNLGHQATKNFAFKNSCDLADQTNFMLGLCRLTGSRSHF